MSSKDVWFVLTSLGNSGLMFPAAAMVGAELLVVRATKPAWHWLVGFIAAVSLVFATKLAFLGWGIGIRPLDFTGISGHTTLASAVLPVLGYLLPTRKYAAYALPGAMLGLGLGAMVGVSRYMVGAHSPSEIIIGFLLGATVAIAFIYSLQSEDKRVLSLGALYIVLILLILGRTEMAGQFRAHDVVVRVALYVSGRAHPYTREEWHRSGSQH